MRTLNLKSRFTTAAWVLALTIALTPTVFGQASPEVRVSVDEVKDSRTTGKFFANLEIQLKLMSESLDDAKRMKVDVQKAVDDTGRDLLDSEKEPSFSEISSSRNGTLECRLTLRNPARRATVVKELAGEIQVYVPRKDTNAAILIEQFLAKAGTPITHPALQAAGVEITAVTAEQAAAEKAKREKEAKEQAAKSGLAGAMGQAFGQMFGGFGMGENAITLKFKDTKSQVVGVEFIDARGKSVRPQMWQTTGENRVYSFDQKLPPETGLRILMLTPKSLIKVPFKLSDITLP